MKKNNKMTLTDNDKREIVQLIQENKPLPDKYRFLLFKDRGEIELLWNGKSNEVTDIVLPFQTIEHVDEPREEKTISLQGNLFDDSGRQLRGWTNKLIWGNNKLILSSLVNGSLYDEIKKQGGLKLVYIDPPFDVGDDFHLDIKIGNNEFEKKRGILEEIAYRDTWGKGSDSFIAMLAERIYLINQLLSEDGNIMVHCDYRTSPYIKIILDEIFGQDNFCNEIIWSYATGGVGKGVLGRKHDTIYWYRKSKSYQYFPDNIKEDRTEKSLKRAQNPKGARVSKDNTKKLPTDVWNIQSMNPMSKERTGYPTQKPEELVEKIILGFSSENDLVADFFCGSGTTLAVAEKLNRKWIGGDLGKFAIHTSRKRLIEIQRELKKNRKNYRAFEILNLGKYQRESFISQNNNDLNKNKENYYIGMILDAYTAEKINNPVLHGIKNNRYVYVGPINIHVSRKAVETVVNECIKKKITKVDILCFDHEQGLFPNIMNEAKEKGVDVSCKIIPPDVFDKRAIDKKQVVFHDVAFIEFKPVFKKKKLFIELTGFSVDYSQEKIDEVLSELKPNKSKVILNSGQIIKISRDKNGIEKKEILTKSWKDWIDYWAVDFDFENKKEIYIEKDETGKFTEKWSGDYIFENEWQSFRSKGKDLEFKSAEKEMRKKTTKVAVKVIDIFGNDTMKVLKVNL